MGPEDANDSAQKAEKEKKAGKITMIIFGALAVLSALVLVILLPIYFTNNPKNQEVEINPLESAMEGIRTTSGYVEVRDNAHMFWMLYYQDDNFKPNFLSPLNPVPVVVWLQGGPGGASTGYGLFEEIGPLDLNLQKRATSWTGLAHILFIDQPVGTGYSYVTDDNAYVKNSEEGGSDLVTLLKGFYEKMPDLKDNPLYIFSQSYGGKFAAAAAQEIAKEIKAGTMDVNFKGVGLGSAFISPEDSLLSRADYLHHWGLLDLLGRSQVNASAMELKALIDNGQWREAYDKKMDTQALIQELTYNVDVYNILYPRNAFVPETDPYDDLMQSQMPDYLGNIPSNVVWGSQRPNVENALKEDNMKPAVDMVDSVLSDGLKVVVYNGMLDAVVSTPGQESWVEKLEWSQIPTFSDKKWTPVFKQNDDTGGFSKSVENFKFWWVIDAGHDIPIDQAEFMLHVFHDTCSSS